eukprot:3112055-Pyramimonas_sp.AAC.1
MSQWLTARSALLGPPSRPAEWPRANMACAILVIPLPLSAVVAPPPHPEMIRKLAKPLVNK